VHKLRQRLVGRRKLSGCLHNGSEGPSDGRHADGRYRDINNRQGIDIHTIPLR
jgi:hypothetical protein